MNFLGIGYNSMSKGYLTYDPTRKTPKGQYLEAPALSSWKLMLKRVHTDVAYLDCEVIACWLDYQNYAEFYYKDEYRQQGWCLDKDILIKDNRVYGPDTCCFVPNEINSYIANYKGIRDRQEKDLPVGVSPFKKQSLFRARVNDSISKKPIVKYFKNIEDAAQAYRDMKRYQLMRLADKWKNEIAPNVYQSLINREF